MTEKIEDKLHNYILTKHKSVRSFALSIGLTQSTMHNILKRGLDNSSYKNIFAICNALDISADALAEGEIVPNNPKNNTNMISTISNSPIMQGNNNNYNPQTEQKQPTNKETYEINRIFENLDVRKRMKMLDVAFALEYEQKQGSGNDERG